MKKIGIFDKITGKKDKKHHSVSESGTGSTSKSSKSPSAAMNQSQSIQAIVT